MKVLVVGTGSIGTRHIKNLVQLGHEVYAVDIKRENLKKVAPKLKGAFQSLSEGLALKPDVAFICTFSNNHIAVALECAKAGCHLFIEKPLSTDIRGADRLIKAVKERKLITMVGCNMRFHPAIMYIRGLLDNNPAFRKVLLADLEFGYNLAFAKPDYKNSYQANRNMGGNLIFDGIHELDYAVWFFGKPKKVFCTKGRLSSLKIDTEDYVEMMIEFESRVVCSVHMDYLQHGYSRRCKIVAEEGTAVWDFSSGKIGIVTEKTKQREWIKMNVELYYNKMYLDEIRYFIGAVKLGNQTFNSVESFIPVLNLALAADRSCASGRWEYVKGGRK